MKIITANLNGIRSAWNKGIYPWLLAQASDIVCFQELKAQAGDLSTEMTHPDGFQAFYHFAEKKGYSGVGIWSRAAPEKITSGMAALTADEFSEPVPAECLAEFDREGRYLRADFDALSVISLYLPSGSSAPERQEAKFRFMRVFYPHLVQLAKSGRRIVVCGDWNIAHQTIDLKNWKSNQKNSGFLPEERAWMSEVLNQGGWQDVYRSLYPDATDECYTWWSNRGQARAKNVGWRLDYQLATPALAGLAQSASVFKETWFSDHAPLIVDYKEA